MDREHFGFYTCRVDDTDVVGLVLRLMEQAKTEVGTVDMVVMPELAITVKVYEELSGAVRRRGAMLLCGYGAEAYDDTPGINRASFDLPIWGSRYQRKHHRWKLSGSQLRQYGSLSVT